MAGLAFTVCALAPGSSALADGWWSQGWSGVLYFGGVTVDDTSDVLTGNFDPGDAQMVGVSIAKTLVKINDDLDLAGEVLLSRYFNGQDLWQLDGAVYLRWHSFPWEQHLRTSFAFGLGPSLASKVPPLERERYGDDHSAKLLNFLFAELALGLPSLPAYDLALRYQHRSGAFGTIDDVRDASTTFAVGIRRHF